MSDFIKVNFKSGNISILSKNALHICYEPAFEGYYIYSTQIMANRIPAIITDYVENLLGIAYAMYGKDSIRYRVRDCVNDAALSLDDYWASTAITREEYDRLCKELVVE